MEDVRSSLLNISEVLSADTVFGPFDIICSVKANNREELERSLAYIQSKITGIEKTMTAVVAHDRFGPFSIG